MIFFSATKYKRPCAYRDAGHFVSCEVVEILANPRPTDVTVIDGFLFTRAQYERSKIKTAAGDEPTAVQYPRRKTLTKAD